MKIVGVIGFFACALMLALSQIHANILIKG